MTPLDRPPPLDPPRDATALSALATELRALVDRVRPWSTARWARSGNAPAIRTLVQGLAGLIVAVGPDDGPPPGVVPPVLGDHALADQVAVLGAHLVAAVRHAGEAGTTAPGAPDLMDLVGDARRLVREVKAQLS